MGHSNNLVPIILDSDNVLEVLATNVLRSAIVIIAALNVISWQPWTRYYGTRLYIPCIIWVNTTAMSLMQKALNTGWCVSLVRWWANSLDYWFISIRFQFICFHIWNKFSVALTILNVYNQLAKSWWYLIEMYFLVFSNVTIQFVFLVCSYKLEKVRFKQSFVVSYRHRHVSSWCCCCWISNQK